MSRWLTLSVRFPHAQFGGTGVSGGEWPPSPARLASCLLAAASLGETGAESARALFQLAPPVIDAVARDVVAAHTGVSRWVANNDRSLQKYGQAGGPSLGGKVEDDGQSVVRLPDNSVAVTYFWRGADGLAASLADVAREVEYLGRPTSPALITVTTLDELPALTAGRERYTPNGAGAVRLMTADVDHLADLDAQYAAQCAGDADVWFGYRGTAANYIIDSVRGSEGLLGNPDDVAHFGASHAIYQVTGEVHRSDSRRVCDCLAAIVETPVLRPVAWAGGDHADGRLVSVIVADASTLPDSVVVPTLAGPVVFRRTLVEDWRRSDALAVEQSTATATAWASVTPLADSAHVVSEALRIAAAADTAIATVEHDGQSYHELFASLAPCDAYSAPADGDERHLIVRFDRAVTGPLSIESASGTSYLQPVADDRSGVWMPLTRTGKSR